MNYNSVAQKLSILAIVAIFDPKNPFLNDSIDVRIKTKAEIRSFYMRYYKVALASFDHQKCKLHPFPGSQGF